MYELWSREKLWGRGSFLLVEMGAVRISSDGQRYDRATRDASRRRVLAGTGTGVVRALDRATT
jgi:hypothetical protein